MNTVRIYKFRSALLSPWHDFLMLWLSLAHQRRTRSLTPEEDQHYLGGMPIP